MFGRSADLFVWTWSGVLWSHGQTVPCSAFILQSHLNLSKISLSPGCYLDHITKPLWHILCFSSSVLWEWETRIERNRIREAREDEEINIGCPPHYFTPGPRPPLQNRGYRDQVECYYSCVIKISRVKFTIRAQISFSISWRYFQRNAYTILFPL